MHATATAASGADGDGARVAEHPPLDCACGSVLVAETHFWVGGSQSAGATQSVLAAQAILQLPLASQLNGAQSVAVPSGATSVCPSAWHFEICTHALAALQTAGATQSASLAQVVRQPSSAHW